MDIVIRSRRVLGGRAEGKARVIRGHRLSAAVWQRQRLLCAPRRTRTHQLLFQQDTGTRDALCKRREEGVQHRLIATFIDAHTL